MTSPPPDRSTVLVRWATVGDAWIIAELLAQLGYPATAGAVAARLARVAQPSGDAVWIATAADVPCGTISLHLIPLMHRDGHLARVTSLVVEWSQRKSGVGSALLRVAEEYALAAGAERLEVTTGDTRSDAHGFYIARGFEREGARLSRWLR